MPTTLEAPATPHRTRTHVASAVKTRRVGERTTKPNDNDPFYSEANLRDLSEQFELHKAGKLRMTEHDLIEV